MAARAEDHPDDRVVRVDRALPFGAAVQTALRHAPAAVENEWLWLLAQDTAPAERALAALLRSVQIAPSVVVAGPKLLNWDRPDFLREFGQTMTRMGARRQLEAEEYDQQQHDTQVDTMSVGPAGMLVNRALWEALGGFDPALPVYDDGLDFGVRARLAGYRVALAADARVRYARDGVAGPRDLRKSSARRRGARQSRTAALHRRMVYAPAGVVWLHWLSLVPLAVLRSLWRLVQKQPGLIPGELAAAFVVAFTPARVASARRRIRARRRVGWDVIRPLRVSLADDRRQRALQREIMHERRGTRRLEAHFLTSGGLGVFLAAALVGVVLGWRYVTSGALVGGGLLPLSGTVEGLWQSASYGLRDPLGSVVGPADPFALVLAVLGTLAAWAPSVGVVLLVVAAPALAALGAWYLAAELSDRPAARAFAALAWALAPVLLVDLADGRLAAVLVHLLLPWLAMAAVRVRRSWPAAGVVALLTAVVLACAPSLAPVAVVVWAGGIVLALVTAPRALPRVLWTIVPALALYVPLAVVRIRSSDPLALLLDPGVAVPGVAAHPANLLLGLPAAGWSGWETVVALVPGVAVPAWLPVVVLAAPLALLALLAVALPGSRRAVVALVVALLGLAAAALAVGVSLTTVGGEPVWLWPGPALSVYWGGLVLAAASALSALGRVGRPLTVVAVAALALLVAPIGVATVAGWVPVRPDAGTLPAVVRAAALGAPDVGTLVVSPLGDGSVAGGVVRGAGPTLDEQSTLLQGAQEPTPAERTEADLIGRLSTEQSGPVGEDLRDLGVAFILLSDSGDSAQAAATEARFRAALDARDELEAAGQTDRGVLWRVVGAQLGSGPADPAPVPDGVAAGIWVATGAALLIALWIALPTTPVRDRPPRAARRRRGASAAGAVDASGAARTRPDSPGPEAPDRDAPAAVGGAGPEADAFGLEEDEFPGERGRLGEPDHFAEIGPSAVADASAEPDGEERR